MMLNCSAGLDIALGLMVVGGTSLDLSVTCSRDVVEGVSAGSSTSDVPMVFALLCD
jgi:hypothetical protein